LPEREKGQTRDKVAKATGKKAGTSKGKGKGKGSSGASVADAPEEKAKTLQEMGIDVHLADRWGNRRPPAYARSIALLHKPTDPRRFGISGRPVYPGRVTHMLFVPPARPMCQMSTLP
jgi:hypothetical protein